MTRMLLQTNSYIVPREKREEHARLVRKFRQVLHRLGCDDFEIYEQVGSNWSTSEATGRYVQIMRFRDRKQQQAVQAAERQDRGAQVVIREFCELINFPYQQQQGLFASGFYQSVLPTAEPRRPEAFRGRVAPVMPARPEPAAPGEPREPAAQDEPVVEDELTPEIEPTEAVPAPEEDPPIEGNGATEAEAEIVSGTVEEELFDIDLDDAPAEDMVPEEEPDERHGR